MWPPRRVDGVTVHRLPLKPARRFQSVKALLRDALLKAPWHAAHRRDDGLGREGYAIRVSVRTEHPGAAPGRSFSRVVAIVGYRRILVSSETQEAPIEQVTLANATCEAHAHRHERLRGSGTTVRRSHRGQMSSQDW